MESGVPSALPWRTDLGRCKGKTTFLLHIGLEAESRPDVRKKFRASEDGGQVS